MTQPKDDFGNASDGDAGEPDSIWRPVLEAAGLTAEDFQAPPAPYLYSEGTPNNWTNCHLKSMDGCALTFSDVAKANFVELQQSLEVEEFLDRHTTSHSVYPISNVQDWETGVFIIYNSGHRIAEMDIANDRKGGELRVTRTNIPEEWGIQKGMPAIEAAGKISHITQRIKANPVIVQPGDPDGPG